jgi:hypothetical protein
VCDEPPPLITANEPNVADSRSSAELVPEPVRVVVSVSVPVSVVLLPELSDAAVAVSLVEWLSVVRRTSDSLWLSPPVSVSDDVLQPEAMTL